MLKLQAIQQSNKSGPNPNPSNSKKQFLSEGLRRSIEEIWEKGLDKTDVQRIQMGNPRHNGRRV